MFINILKDVMCLIFRDCLTGEKFSKRLSKIQLEKTPFFSQFKMDCEEEELILKKCSYRLLPLSVIAKIFRNIILEVIHDMFNLGRMVVSEKGLDNKANVKTSASCKIFNYLC